MPLQNVCFKLPKVINRPLHILCLFCKEIHLFMNLQNRNPLFLFLQLKSLFFPPPNYSTKLPLHNRTVMYSLNDLCRVLNNSYKCLEKYEYDTYNFGGTICIYKRVKCVYTPCTISVSVLGPCTFHLNTVVPILS